MNWKKLKFKSRIFFEICYRARQDSVLQSIDSAGLKQPVQSLTELFFLVLYQLNNIYFNKYKNKN